MYGRVGEDHVHRRVEVAEGVGGVAGPQVDAGAGQVAPRVRERLLGQLHRVHPRPRRLVGDRLGDGPGPGAQVDEHRLLDAGRTLLDQPARSPSRRAARSPGAA
jgi:hypothetical protein